ncbi:carbohydrate ABC transporter substrate-binding protein, CUT1 family (TC 3.A.1.1.-) [Gracilibacillus ureilyticus]|uniref:Carbohydrate ABC transporter substrate-binding protein, CUT1 family (TC 3.A.1.1.-) n=1 Tax=Gracilibacillus ureilyticus TaxID=531814 RepID=A0A1H9N136_9BACI|nr:extracellular solute-binding protein [Gracilibacillus ureilyticus]SER29487.1 carbohydrate ABC transporter substrate-binding protein, CUT1 family (TC 3.A.1.1.-) [Gracilibacillus ureilyticus]
MKDFKKLFSLFILLLILFTAAGCSSSEGTGGGGESEAFSFSMMATLHTPETPDEKILNEIEQATNTNIDIQWIPGNNYQDRLNSAFATNSLPDAVFFGNQAIFNQFRGAMEDGQFWEVGKYIDDYENLSKLKDTILDNTRVNGKLYALYQGVPLSRQGLIYRKDWAESLGLDAPTNTEEFMEMARAFTEDDPDGNGEDDTFGLTDRSDLIYGAFKTVSSWFGTPNNWGEKEGELLPEFMFDEYMQTLDFFREMHENGYINQDFPVTSKTDQQEFFKNGTAGMYVGAMGDVSGLYRDAAALNPDLEFEVQNRIEGPDGEFGVWSVPGYGNALMFPKSAVETEEELKNLLAFFDKMMTPEVANLANWGIEGEHYEVVDGKALPSDDKQITDREVRPYLSILIGEPETRGSYESIMELEVKAKSEELIKDNENYLIEDPTVTLYSETYLEEGTRLQQIITDATYNYILGKIDKDGFASAVEEWKSEGGSAIIEEYNASFKESK